MIDRVAPPKAQSYRTQALRAARTACDLTLPHVNGRPLWIPGVRVVLALYAPLLVGLAINNVGIMVPIAVGALVGALTDPGGPAARRGVTIAATSVMGAAAFTLGDLAGRTPLGAILFVSASLFVTGLAPEFGAAGIRGALYVATLGILGVSTAGVDPGWVTPNGLLLGGLWALALALGPFAQRGQRVVVPLHERTRRFGADLLDHALLRTAIGRHAARLAVAAGLGVALSLALGFSHIGWIAAAAIAVLHPQSTTCASRSVRLLSGTVFGALLVALALQILGPNAWLLALAVPVLFLAVSLRSVDYVSYTVAFTAFFLALSSFGQPNGWALFSERVLDTLIGIAVAIAIWALTMPRSEIDRLQGEIADRQRA